MPDEKRNRVIELIKNGKNIEAREIHNQIFHTSPFINIFGIMPA